MKDPVTKEVKDEDGHSSCQEQKKFTGVTIPHLNLSRHHQHPVASIATWASPS